MMFYLRLGLRGGASTKNPIPERVGRWLRKRFNPTFCALGMHEATWYASGWFDVDGALIQWICSRTHHWRHWGCYSDGPRGRAYPTPTKEEQERWAIEGLRLRALDDERRAWRELTARLCAILRAHVTRRS